MYIYVDHSRYFYIGIFVIALTSEREYIAHLLHSSFYVG